MEATSGMSRRNMIRPSATDFVVAISLLAAIVSAFCVAPTERTMGDSQRIVYIHVPLAWLGLIGMLVMAVGGAVFLARRKLVWDQWAQSACEVGWLCSGLTIITGSLWAHEAWGTWWEWDPRLTSSFVLWLIYSGILLARSSIVDPHRRARVAAILAIVGTSEIPLVVMATRWFRGMHPVSPEMEPTMRVTLAIGVIAWTFFFAWLTSCRRAQVGLERSCAEFRRSPGVLSANS